MVSGATSVKGASAGLRALLTPLTKGASGSGLPCLRSREGSPHTWTSVWLRGVPDLVPFNTAPRAGLPASRASESWAWPPWFGRPLCPLCPSVMPWHCSVPWLRGAAVLGEGEGQLCSSQAVAGWKDLQSGWGPPKNAASCSPHPCLQCQHLGEPCRARTRPDMCFHLAQTMTRPVLG